LVGLIRVYHTELALINEAESLTGSFAARPAAAANGAIFIEVSRQLLVLLDEIEPLVRVGPLVTGRLTWVEQVILTGTVRG